MIKLTKYSDISRRQYEERFMENLLNIFLYPHGNVGNQKVYKSQFLQWIKN